MPDIDDEWAGIPFTVDNETGKWQKENLQILLSVEKMSTHSLPSVLDKLKLEAML